MICSNRCLRNASRTCGYGNSALRATFSFMSFSAGNAPLACGYGNSALRAAVLNSDRVTLTSFFRRQRFARLRL
jgi:hypothetical protein